MTINGAKTKTMRVGVNEGDDQPAITLKRDTLEDVEAFSYLGNEVGKTAGVDGEVGTRLKKAATTYQMWRRKVFRSKSFTKKTKVHVFRVMVMSVLLYGAETWAVTRQELKRLHAFQMKCLRDIIGVILWDQKRNEDILAETGEMPVEDQLKLKRLWPPAKDARPPSAATCTQMPPSGQKEEAWRNPSPLDRHCEQRPG